MKMCRVCGNEYEAWMQFCPRDSSELVAAEPEPAPCAGSYELQEAADGRYQKLGLIAKTPIGEVYLAEDTFLRRRITLLLVSPDLTSEERGDLFLRYRALSALSHPNLSTVFSLERVEGRPAGIVEHFEASFLDQLIAAEGPFQAARAAGLARQAAAGLEAIHEAGIIHKDIRPANALVNQRGVLKLINFSQALVPTACTGKARAIDGLFEKLRWLGSTADPLLELAYTAPEQLRTGSITPRTDVYGVGAMLYGMLSGHPPFRAASISELVHEISGAEPAPLAPRTPLEAELCAIAMRCLAKDPLDRYASAGDLVAALEGLEHRLLVAEASDAPSTVLADPNDPELSIATQLQAPTTAPLTGGSIPPPADLPHPGDLIEGRYRIDAVQGRGGMGAVYRATDVDLDRSLAIKVLHPQLLSDETALRRFRHEARAAARLRHPNAVTVYGFGQLASGAAYIAMELCEGVTLRDELRRRGRLALDEAAHILGQIADAVDAAHQAGLVHRDLKPDNVMLERRPGGTAVKVLDFGIAKVISSTDTDRLTVPHAIIGTPVYMSPEQASGEPVDARSDIYSLGVMLFEMLSGGVPFTAETPVALALKHVTEPPPPLRAFVPELPERVEAVVLEALAKRPSDRPASALELAQTFWEAITETERVGARAAAARVGFASEPQAGSTLVASSPLPIVERPTPHAPPAPADAVMIAILPLRILSPDPADEFFAEGLTEEIVTALSRIGGVGIISRTSTARFKSSSEPLPEIGARLGASFVLEGSLRRHGSRIRIAAQLVCVARDTHVWAETFDGDMDDVLAIQSQIASEIVGGIREHLV